MNGFRYNVIINIYTVLKCLTVTCVILELCFVLTLFQMFQLFLNPEKSDFNGGNAVMSVSTFRLLEVDFRGF